MEKRETLPGDAAFTGDTRRKGAGGDVAWHSVAMGIRPDPRPTVVPWFHSSMAPLSFRLLPVLLFPKEQLMESHSSRARQKYFKYS